MDKAPDLRLCFNLNGDGKRLSGDGLCPLRLVGFVGLVLRESVSELVDTRLVESLQRLKDKGRLGIPLLLSRLEFRRSNVNFLGTGLTTLFVQLVGLVAGVFEVLAEIGQVG